MTSNILGAALRLSFAWFAAVALLLAIPAGPAHADCVQVGTTVTCSGASPGGFNAGPQDGLTVNVAAGSIVGTGLFLNNNNVVSNLGTVSVGDSVPAIEAGANNQITSSGSIQGGFGAAGIVADNGASVLHSGTLTVGDGGTGIALNGTGSVLNSGTITAGIGPIGGGAGIGGQNVTNTGTIRVGDGGIAVVGTMDFGALTNRGSIIAGAAGTGIGNPTGANALTVINSGSITFGDCGAGIELGNGSGHTVLNSGSITETGCGGVGIQAGDASTITNSGTITVGATGAGIIASDASAVINSGVITVGDLGVGIGGGDATSILNSGTIVAGESGVGITSIGNSGTITNTGTIIVGDSIGFGGGIIGFGDNFQLTNTGTIVGGANAPGMITLGDNGVLINSGTITVGSGGGGLIGQGLNTSFLNSGTITVGPGGIGIDAQQRGAAIVNTGTINAGGNNGIGIQAVEASAIANFGTIGVGASGVGISGGDGTTVFNDGQIIAGTNGIGMMSGGNMANAGTIIVGDSTSLGTGGMVGLGDNLQLANTGTITGGTGTPAMIVTGSNGMLANTGTITVGVFGGGMVAQGGNASFVNSGAITVGAGGIGIAALGPNATVVNSGVIAAPTAIALATSGNATATNSGTLNGAVSLAGGGGSTLTNAGLITVAAPLVPGGGVAHFVDGTFTQTASGVFTTRITPNNAPGNYDTLSVGSTVASTGVANLGGRLSPIVQPGLYGLSTTYAGVLTFASSTGRFADLSPLSLFLGLSAIYNPTSVDLVVTRTPFNQLAGGGANARAVGNVLEANYSTGLTGSLASFYSQLLLSTAPNTLLQLTGEVATAAQNASFTMFGQFLGTLFGQTGSMRALGGAASASAGTGTRVALAAAPGATLPCTADACDATPTPTPPLYTAWAQGFGSSASIDRNANIGNSRLDMNWAGGAAGVDMSLGPNALVGVTLGTASGGYSLTDLLSSGGAQSILFGLYGGYAQGPAYVDGALGFAYNTFNTNRFIGTGSLSEVANASFDGYQYGGRVEGGWRFALGRSVLAPFMGLTMQALTQGAYSETSRNAATGAPGMLGVTIQGQTSTSIRSTIGAEFQTAITANDDTVFRPRLRLGWAHEFNVYRTVTATLSALLPNAPFTVMGAQPSPDALIVSAGFDLELSRMVRIYGQFDGDFSDNARAFAGTGGVRLVW